MPVDNGDLILDPVGTDEPVPETAIAGAPQPDADKLELSEDGNLVKRGDKVYIRKEALDEERGARQKLQGALNAIEPLMPEFEEFLQSKQGRGRAQVARVAAPVDDEDEYSDDELEGLATVRGYYDADNKPDKARAKAELNLLSRVADRRSAKMVGPVAQNAMRERANTNVRQAMDHRFLDGEPIADQKYLKAVFDALPEDARADASITNIATLAAAGLEYLEQRKNGGVRRGRREPNFREGPSSRGGGSLDLDALDIAAAKARGKTPEQWAKLTKAATGSNQLED
jgi:hypothetical protein